MLLPPLLCLASSLLLHAHAVFAVEFRRSPSPEPFAAAAAAALAARASRQRARLGAEHERAAAPTAATDADPCAGGTAATCGASAAYCSQACAWAAANSTCVSVDDYPAPSNASLAALVGASSPLTAADFLTISFYGDSITYLGLYEKVLTDALAASPHTARVAVRVLNQGVNGGTLADLIRGYSPWGHLDPQRPQSNISFAQTLARDAPDYVVVQIGINDVWQAGPACGDRCSNASAFAALFAAAVAAPVAARGAQLVLASVSTIGEARDGDNALDGALDGFAAAQAALAAALRVPFVPLRAADEAYLTENNCRNLSRGVLTYDGVHPSARGAANLANLHAGGLLAAMALAPPAGRPPPARYGGRLFFTSGGGASTAAGGIAGADALCAAQAPGGADARARALLVDEAGCAGAPCRRASLSPWAGDGQIDWPLAPAALYYSADNTTAVALTDGAGLLAYPLFSPVRAQCQNQASGMAADFTTRAGFTCDSWTAGAPPAQQGVGWSCALDDGLLDGGAVACGQNDWLCVLPA